MAEDALLAPDVARRLSGGISESTQRRLIAAGDYPAPVTLSTNRHGKAARVAFVEAEVQAWCRRRIAAGRGQQDGG